MKWGLWPFKMRSKPAALNFIERAVPFSAPRCWEFLVHQLHEKRLVSVLPCPGAFSSESCKYCVTKINY